MTLSPRQTSVAEFAALARHAATRVALYRRRVYLGRGEPRKLAELERESAGAHDRWKRARRAASDQVV